RPPPRLLLFPYTTLFRSSAPFWQAGPSAVVSHHVKYEEHVLTGRAFWDDDADHGQHRSALIRPVPGVLRNTIRPEGPRGSVSKRSEEHTSELQSRFDLVC